MSEGIPHGAVERLLHGLTVDIPQAIRRRDSNRDQNAPRELDQQFQFQISGVAGTFPAFETVSITFDYAFFFAPAARESTLEFPHFTYGSHTSPAVGIHATVTEWMRDESNGSIIGAVVAVGAVGAPGTEFSGMVHLTFQGWGLLSEEALEAGEGE